VLLAIAYLMNALYALPYTLGLAAGRTTIPLLVNVASAPVVVGVTYAVVPSVGLTGAAAVWLVLMTLHLGIYSVWIDRVILRQRFAWLLNQAARYAIAGLLTFGLARLLALYADRELVSYAFAAVAVAVYTGIAIRLLPVDLRGLHRTLRASPEWTR
jgi:hypothetical protein